MELRLYEVTFATVRYAGFIPDELWGYNTFLEVTWCHRNASNRCDSKILSEYGQ